MFNSGLTPTSVSTLSDLIRENQRRYGGARRKFLKLDVLRDPLPQADLILCRDCLVHFSLQDVMRTLKNFQRSKSTYLLTTTFTGARPNKDIAVGEWRPLNLQLPPFNFPLPLRMINERCDEADGAYADKCLGLWRLQDLAL